MPRKPVLRQHAPSMRQGESSEKNYPLRPLFFFRALLTRRGQGTRDMAIKNCAPRRASQLRPEQTIPIQYPMNLNASPFGTFVCNGESSPLPASALFAALAYGDRRETVSVTFEAVRAMLDLDDVTAAHIEDVQRVARCFGVRLVWCLTPPIPQGPKPS